MNLDAIAAARSTSMILPKTEDRASSDTLIGLSAERGDKAKLSPSKRRWRYFGFENRRRFPPVSLD
jgi:hypothetical protein